MAKKATSTIPAEKSDLYNKLIATIPGLERKGAAMPYTSLNGHMFSFLDKDGNLALRLPKTELQKFIETYKTQLCVQHGTVLKEYAVVPGKLFENTLELADYFQISYNYVGGLKPKK
ncbi:MAG TPA: hypothetical protein VEC12_14005 [Bacteroidia bacterium]|nr:hypothetical protein [Bacteroidia bacterium]